MKDLEKQLRAIKKPEPTVKFCETAKKRLLQKIILEKNESWFAKLINKITPNPSAHFIKLAKIRLMARITAVKKPVITWVSIFKRIMASSLVMLLAVTTTFLFAGEKQPVAASYDSYLQVVTGDVKIKHSNKVTWDSASESMKIVVGDVLKLNKNATVTVHFFDDSQLRLSGTSSVLFNRLEASAGFEEQGIIEVSLQEGKAWVQALNIDDGFAEFTLSTPNTVIATINGTFDVQTNILKSTDIRVFKNTVNVSAVSKNKKEIYAEGQLNVAEKISISPVKKYYQGIKKLENIAKINDLTSEDRNEQWIKNNLAEDQKHLAQIREREIIRLKNSTGLLPGQVLYPLKRAKERLHVALKEEADELNYKINLANRRLNESIVLMESGETKKAKEVLGEYQALVDEIAKQSKSDKNDKLPNKIIVQHQKLIATLPGDTNIAIVKDVLDKTEENLEEDPIKKAEIKLQNSLEDLMSVQDYVVAGKLEEAQRKLQGHKIITAEVAQAGITFKDDDQKKAFYEKLLSAQNNEQRVLNEINHKLADKSADNTLVLLVQDKDADMDKVINKTAQEIKPILPDVNLKKVVKLPKEEKAIEFANKIKIYESAKGQENQIARLFNEYPSYAQDTEFLLRLESKLDLRAKELITAKILRLEAEKTAAIEKEEQLKMDRMKNNNAGAMQEEEK